MGKMPGMGTLGGLGELPGLEEGRPRRAAPPSARISLQPEVVGGGGEDPLEKAAMQGVDGSLPERIVWKYLATRGHLFTAQSAAMGGRLTVGGAVVDFLVYDLGARPVAMRVQGDYWHGPARPDQQARDDAQASRLRGQGYVVADLWESDIYQAVRFDRLGAYIREEVGRAG